MTAKEINLAGGQKVYNKEKEDALLEAQKTELVEKIESADAALDSKIDTAVEGLVEKIESADTALDSKIDDAVENLTNKIEDADIVLDNKITDLGTNIEERVNTKYVHATKGIMLDTLTTAAPVTSSAGVGYDEAGNLVPIKVVAQIGLPENAPFVRTDAQGNAKKGTVYDGVAEPGATSTSLVTEAAFAKRGNARTDVHTTTGEINENLIFRATQHTANYEKSAFDGLFYEVASFMESSQIPAGAKLIYLYDNMLRFCTTYPPYSGLQYGADESVEANRLWFESIDWMSVEGTSGTYNLTAGVQVLPVGNTKDISSVKIGYTNAEGIEVTTTEVPTVPAYNYNVEGKVGSLSYDIKFSGTTATVVLTPDEGVTATNIYVEVSYTTHSVIVVPLEDFSYTTPVIKVQDAEVAPQNILSFVDYRENATDELLDKRSAETAATVKINTAAIAANTNDIAANTDDIAANTNDIALTKQDILDFKDQMLTIEARKQLPGFMFMNFMQIAKYDPQVQTAELLQVSDDYVLYRHLVSYTSGRPTYQLYLFEATETVLQYRANTVYTLPSMIALSACHLYEQGMLLALSSTSTTTTSIVTVQEFDKANNYALVSYNIQQIEYGSIRDITRCNNKYYAIVKDSNNTEFKIFRTIDNTLSSGWEEVAGPYPYYDGVFPQFMLFEDTVVILWTRVANSENASNIYAYFVEDEKLYSYTIRNHSGAGIAQIAKSIKLNFVHPGKAIIPIYKTIDDYQVNIVYLNRSTGFSSISCADQSHGYSNIDAGKAITMAIPCSDAHYLVSCMDGTLYRISSITSTMLQVKTTDNKDKFYYLRDVGFFVYIDSSTLGFIRGSVFYYLGVPPFSSMEQYYVSNEMHSSANFNLAQFFETRNGLVATGNLAKTALYYLPYSKVKDQLYTTKSILGI